MVRLIRAFPAAPLPGPAMGPVQHLAGLTQAQACGRSPRGAGRPVVSGAEGDAG
jgi:hypothetical protein